MDATYMDFARAKPIRTWDESLLALARELAEDMKRTRELYERAKESADTEE